MRFTAIFALLATAQAADAVADPEAAAALEKRAQAIKEKSDYIVSAFKGMHNGFYKAFYKETESTINTDECLNDETTTNIATYAAALSDPSHIFAHIANAQEGFNAFAKGAEIYENFAKCRLEGPTFDIIHLCASDKDACTPTTLGTNLTKNMFVLVGKITSLTETFKNFPSKDKDEFKEQMSQIGDDAGTIMRVLFNYTRI